MSRSMLSFSLCAVVAVAAAVPAYAGNPSTSQRTPTYLSSLLAVQLGKHAAQTAQPGSLRVAPHGSVTTAMRTLDLEALKVADFGDEPVQGSH